MAFFKSRKPRASAGAGKPPVAGVAPASRDPAEAASRGDTVGPSSRPTRPRTWYAEQLRLRKHLENKAIKKGYNSYRHRFSTHDWFRERMEKMSRGPDFVPYDVSGMDVQSFEAWYHGR